MVTRKDFRQLLGWTFALFFVFTPIANGQGFFILEIPTDPRTNGMGNIAGTIPSTSALATMTNPGQLGLFALDNNFSGTTLLQKSQWLPSVFTDMSVDARAAQLGINLTRALNLPFEFAFGVGYGYGNFQEGHFALTTSSGPTVIATVNPSDRYTSWSFGVAIRYGVKVAFGMNSKRNKSEDIPALSATGVSTTSAEITSHDWGLMMQIPVFDLVKHPDGTAVEIAPGVLPFVDISASYAHTNIGGEFSYIDIAQKDPLPRTALMGLGVETGLTLKRPTFSWCVVSVTIARQADAALFDYGAPPTYKSGSGPLKFWENIVEGKTSQRVLGRKGWEISVGEILAYRAGSVEGGGYNYSTKGYSLSLSGLLKGVSFASGELEGNSSLRYVLNHFDLVYDHASYGDNIIQEGMTWSGLQLTIRNFW